MKLEKHTTWERLFKTLDVFRFFIYESIERKMIFALQCDLSDTIDDKYKHDYKFKKLLNIITELLNIKESESNFFYVKIRSDEVEF